MAWSPLAPSADPPPALAPTLDRLSGARRHLGLRLEWVQAWAPSARQLDNLRFRLELKDAGLVGKVLRASVKDRGDFERVPTGAAPPPPPGYAEARAGLLAALAECRDGSWRPDAVREAASAYEAAVERELVGPLQEWALAGGDPVVRAAGAELAGAAGLLHRMAPLLDDLQGAQLGWPKGASAAPPELFAQYLALVGRFGGLLRDLGRWREKS